MYGLPAEESRATVPGVVKFYWILMIAVILIEVLGTTCMKLSDGFRKLKPSIGLAVFYTLFFGCLTLAMGKSDVSIACALWSVMGTALITVIGILYFKERKTYVKFVGEFGEITNE
jgi:small multidrug resistance pump